MLVILDRDGVINEDSLDYIKSVSEWVPIQGSLQAIAELKKAGHTVAIATNQSGIARGLFTEETLLHIHQKIEQILQQEYGVRVDGFFYCPHHPDDHCVCRKPAPGLLIKIGNELQMDITKALCIGDSIRDIQAAQCVGATPLLVLTGNGQKTLQNECLDKSIAVYEDLAGAVSDILSHASKC